MFVLTVILPVVGYNQIKSSLSGNIDLGTFKLKYDAVFISTIILGIILTGIRYFIYQFQRFSIKRGSLTLLNSILFTVILTINSQLGNLNITFENLSFYLNLSGVFVLLISVWVLFIIKNTYDLIDYKINSLAYEKLMREKSRKLNKRISKRLIKCSKCKYACRPEWKKCPICSTHLRRKR